MQPHRTFTTRSQLVREIKRAWSREAHPEQLPKGVTLLTAPLSQTKMAKGRKLGVYSWILNLAPATESGITNTCPWAGACAKSCIAGAGQNAMSPAKRARAWRTRLYHSHRALFMELLSWELESAVEKAERDNMIPSFRLNGLSDLDWSAAVREAKRWYPKAEFYDYTKGIKRALRLQKSTPEYRLIYSWNERSPNELPDVQQFMQNGGSMAVVFSTGKGERLPESFLGHPVIDGDETDVRFLDEPGVVVGLRFKSARALEAKRDEAIREGFCVKVS